MERVAADIEGLNLGIVDLDAFLVGALVENAFDARAAGTPPVTITATRRRTRSAASAGRRSA
jgi:hypothetical protein